MILEKRNIVIKNLVRIILGIVIVVSTAFVYVQPVNANNQKIDISKWNCYAISAQKDQYTYNGKNIKPKLVGSTKEAKAFLRSKSNYTVKYKYNKYASYGVGYDTPTVILKGKGKYTGTYYVGFSITGRKLKKIEVKKKAKKSVTLRWTNTGTDVKIYCYRYTNGKYSESCNACMPDGKYGDYVPLDTSVIPRYSMSFIEAQDVTLGKETSAKRMATIQNLEPHTKYRFFIKYDLQSIEKKGKHPYKSENDLPIAGGKTCYKSITVKTK